jgi:hypothetical protein
VLCRRHGRRAASVWDRGDRWAFVFAAPADITRAADDMPPNPARSPYRWTTGHVSVRATPPRACTRDTINLANSSMFRASARAMTSYGPIGHAHRPRHARQVPQRRGHPSSLANLCLDQNVRRDHLTPSTHPPTIQHAEPNHGAPTGAPDRSPSATVATAAADRRP